MQNKNFKIGSLKEHTRILTTVVEPPKSSRNMITNSKSEKEFSFINNVGSQQQTAPDSLPT